MTDHSFAPYHLGIGGFLLDRNGDGHPDDLAVRLVLPPEPAEIETPFWCALVDLAARLGLETGGLPDRIVLTATDPLPPDCVPLRIRPAGSPDGSDQGGMILNKAADALSLIRNGLPDLAITSPESNPAL